MLQRLDSARASQWFDALGRVDLSKHSFDVFLEGDHPIPAYRPLSGSKAPTFLSVKARDFVIVQVKRQVA